MFLPGIRNVDEMYEVGLFRKDFYDDIVEVNIDESMDAMLTLIRKCGILAGPTGGGSLAAALKYLQKIDSTLTSKQNAVFIVCDRVEWYLSYLQKCRPEIFGLSVKQDSVKAVPAQDLETAPEVTLEQAETWLTQNPRPFIVDMRGSLAFKASRIPGSINIPADNLEDISDMGVPFANGHKVLFVCPTGDQSKRYAAYFAKQGVECASLKGGFVAWRDANKNTERSAITRRSKVLTGSGA
jgi:rhodanese-related sulfurtransferase